jgi:adenylate cyclase
MSDQVPRRRLAAILAADVVGYSRLMSADEAGTLAALKVRRHDIFQPLVAKHHGRVVKVMGDGALVEFASAVNAVACSVELQEAMDAANADLPEDRRIVLRVGINLGDVMVEGSDLYGDGVNIAARLEAMAEPGSVVVSEKVRQETVGKLVLSFEDLGEQSLKNIAEPVRSFRVLTSAGDAPVVAEGAGSKPSLAILPFTNMSGDPEQEYFSDGITEDIITDLSQVSGLFVVARNTAFTFKGKAVEVTQVARRLRVHHVLEGSVRKSGGRLRITVQLIDGATGGHLWAERYDRDLGDVFALQDEITRSVVAALRVRLLPEESRLIADRTTSSADAYEYYLQGRATLVESFGSNATLRAARDLFAKAIEIDAGYAKAYAGIANCDALLWANGDPDVSFEHLIAMTDKAMELAPNLAEAHAARGMAYHVAGCPEVAVASFQQAIERDPLVFGAHFWLGLSRRDLNQLGEAAALFQRAAELRPDDFACLGMLADVYEAQGRRHESQSAVRRGLIRIEAILKQRPTATDVLAMGAASKVYLGEFARAEEWAERAVQLEPDNFTARYNVACAYAVMGKPELALEHLEYAFARNPRGRPWALRLLRVDMQFNSMRNRSDFQAFMKRLEAAVEAKA